MPAIPSAIDRDTWRQLRDNVPAVTAAVASKAGGVNLEAAGRAQYVHGQRVSASILTFLAFAPCSGAALPLQKTQPGGPRAVVLSYSLWKNTFDGDPNIVGQSIRLKGVPYTVIGVLPPGAQTPSPVDLWTSLRPDTSEEGGGDNFDPILRLKDGATWQQADAQLSQLQSLTSRVLQKKYPGAQISYYAVPLQQSARRGNTHAGDDPHVGGGVCPVGRLRQPGRPGAWCALAAENLRLPPASRSGLQNGRFSVNSGWRVCCSRSRASSQP